MLGGSGRPAGGGCCGVCQMWQIPFAPALHGGTGQLGASLDVGVTSKKRASDRQEGGCRPPSQPQILLWHRWVAGQSRGVGRAVGRLHLFSFHWWISASVPAVRGLVAEVQSEALSVPCRAAPSSSPCTSTCGRHQSPRKKQKPISAWTP